MSFAVGCGAVICIDWRMGRGARMLSGCDPVAVCAGLLAHPVGYLVKQAYVQSLVPPSLHCGGLNRLDFV